ncbi:hypothetical protein TRFO_10095 [Tritrichomonas foetus]|uniref:Transcription initiation factor IIF subunit alpha n=1 Tax=Tritrichomonas foetus TaxID=1144522 RepID=A0A1J4JEV8_9EUKA|nr:hypothetical protein TRFO_10095 [Tritrichomonas foetus]|eukprot:OHS96179.1 hypothetical protein TRFO_10095 [Tritrichomonas foetus]
MIQKNFKFIAEDYDRKERLRKLQAKELAEAGGEDVVDSEGDGEGDDEVGADVSDVFDDDEEIDPETLLDEISEVSDFNKSDFDDDSEEEEKKEKKPKEEITTPTVNENGQVMTAEEINQNVVISILGEEVIKDDEVVRYMRDVGAATAKQLMAKFKPKLKTEAQKQAFKKIVVKRLQSFQLSGVMHYKLRSNRK